jgi:hypothetical protein
LRGTRSGALSAGAQEVPISGHPAPRKGLSGAGATLASR